MGRLAVTRRVNERVRVGDAIITVVKTERGKVCLVIDAPNDVEIFREEVDPRVTGKPRGHAAPPPPQYGRTLLNDIDED